MDLKANYQINPDYLLREIAGDYAIIPVGEACVISNAVMTPNDTAVFLWKEFESPNNIENVKKKALEEYDAPEDIIEKDIMNFISQSMKLNIIREVNEK